MAACRRDAGHHIFSKLLKASPPVELTWHHLYFGLRRFRAFAFAVERGKKKRKTSPACQRGVPPSLHPSRHIWPWWEWWGLLRWEVCCRLSAPRVFQLNKTHFFPKSKNTSRKKTFGLLCIQSWSTHAARAWNAINNVRPFYTFREVIYYYYCVGMTLIASVIKPLACSNGSSLMSCLQGKEGFKDGKLIPSKMKWSWPAWESPWQGPMQIEIPWEQGRPLITNMNSPLHSQTQIFLCSIAKWEIFDQQTISEIISSLILESESDCFAECLWKLARWSSH